MAAIAVSFAMKKAESLGSQLAVSLPSYIWGEMKLLWGVSVEIKYIKEELEIMMAFLRCAEQMQETDDVAKAWVKQVRQLAYDIEDCFDEFALHLSRSGRRGFLESLWHRIQTVGRRHRIATEIPALKSRVEYVSQRRARYTLTDKTSASASGSSLGDVQRDASSFTLNVEETKIVRFDEREKEIIDYLLQADEKRWVIAVFGMSGMGKSFLTRKVYESSEVRDGRFKCYGWITVSTTYPLDDLLKNLLQQVLESTSNSSDVVVGNVDKMPRSQVVEKIKNHLKDKSYLIVFDEVRTIQTWTELKSVIPENDFGSRIILTTPVKDIANSFLSQANHFVYKLEKLSIEEAQQLFYKRVFPPPDHSCPENLKAVTDGILKKCDGLPLIILTIAGILASKPKKTREEDWNNLLKHLGSELESNQIFEAMKQALTLGYVGLHYHLKHCFLYLSIFPDGHLIKRKRLQRLWIAEGFVREYRTKSAENVAESYFNELVSRNMILPSEMDPQGKVKSFKVHDVMHELIVSKSIEANSVTAISSESLPVPDDVIRRLSVHEPSAYENIPESMNLSRVRTLTMFASRNKGSCQRYPHLQPMSLLRVLDLEGCELLEDDNLKMMGTLPHLRYLSLRRTKLKRLPESFGTLRNLETLDIRETEIIEVPSWILKLQQLHYLRGGRRSKPDSVISHEKQHTTTHKTNTYHKTHIPRGISKVKSLVTLTGVDMRRSKGVAKEIGELTKLKKLGVYSLTTKNGLKFCSSISNISSGLRSLSIDFDNSEPPVDLLEENLVPLPLQLQCLELSGPLVKVPHWVGNLKKLGKLTLNYTSFGADGMQLQILQALPSLMHLRLLDTAYIGDHLCFESGFRRLRVLHIDMSPLKQLTFCEGAMPKLELFHMSFLNNLQRIDGGRYLTNLKEIMVSKDLKVIGKRDLRNCSDQDCSHRDCSNRKLVVNESRRNEHR